MASLGFLVKPMQNTLNKKPSDVLTSVNASMVVCFFLIIDRSLSVVMSMPWKFVKQTFPCTSSTTNLNFLNASSLAFKSPKEISNTRPLRPSEAISYNERISIYKLSFSKIRKKIVTIVILVPVVRVTGVLPI